jgi:hypothetical protein
MILRNSHVKPCAVVITVLQSVAPIGDITERTTDVSKLPPCEAMQEHDGHPTQEEWDAAVGDSRQVRFQRASEPDRWVVGYDPLWTVDGLLARPTPKPDQCLFCPSATASFDTVAVGWAETYKLDRYTRPSAVPGLVIGAAIGVGLFMAYGEQGYVEIAIISLAVVTPAAVIVGGIIASWPRWKPMLDCSKAEGDAAEPADQEAKQAGGQGVGYD